MTEPLLDVRDFRSDEFVSAADLNRLAGIIKLARRRAAGRYYRTRPTEHGRAVWETVPINRSKFATKRGLLTKDDPGKLFLRGEGLWVAGLNFRYQVMSGIGGSENQFAKLLRNGVRPMAHFGRTSEYTHASRINTWGATVSDGDDWIEPQTWRNGVESSEVDFEAEYSPSMWAFRATHPTLGGAWSSPPTLASSDKPTAAQLNAVRDAIRYVLNPPHALATEADTDVSLPAGTWTPAEFDLIHADNASFWGPSQPTRFVAPETAIYLLLGAASITKGGGNQALRLLENGSTVVARATTAIAASSYKTREVIGTLHKLQAGDYVELQVHDSLGGTTITPERDSSPQLCAIRLGFDTAAGEWTDPTVLARLDGATHTWWNTYIRDNLVYLFAPPACFVRRTADQTGVADGTWTTVTFPSGSATEDFDTDGMHSLSSHTSRVTMNDAGIYLIGGRVPIGYVSPGTGGVWARMLLNGTDIIAHKGPAIRGDTAHIGLLTLWKADAGDYVEIQGFSGLGATNSFPADSRGPCLWAIPVAA